MNHIAFITKCRFLKRIRIFNCYLISFDLHVFQCRYNGKLFVCTRSLPQREGDGELCLTEFMIDAYSTASKGTFTILQLRKNFSCEVSRCKWKSLALKATAVNFFRQRRVKRCIQGTTIIEHISRKNSSSLD